MPHQSVQDLLEPLQSPEGGSASPGAAGRTSAWSHHWWRSREARLLWWLAMHACMRAHLRVLGESRGQGLQLQAAKSPTLALHRGGPWLLQPALSSVPETP